MSRRLQPRLHEEARGLESRREILSSGLVRIVAEREPRERRESVRRLVVPVGRLFHVAHPVLGRLRDPRLEVQVDLLVELPSTVVTGVEVVFETHPHLDCPRITEHYG